MSEWQNRFWELLLDPMGENLKIEEAFNLKYQNLPTAIFKYQRFSDNSIENLKNNTVHLNSPSSYNDPYDSVLSWNSAALLDSAYAIHKKNFNGLDLFDFLRAEIIETYGDKTEVVISILKDYELKHTNDMGDRFSSLMQEHMKICCFSSVVDNLLLWSHYASDHKGFCVEYELTKLGIQDFLSRLLFPVIYIDQPFDVTSYFQEALTNKDFNNLLPFLCAAHKAKDWEYEREWRLIFPPDKKSLARPYQMPVPKAVYLGTKISADHEKQILDILKEKNVTVYKMVKRRREFGLDPNLLWEPPVSVPEVPTS